MNPLDRPACPCGLDAPLDACCGRLIRGAALATSPEELMRSRYTAYAVGAIDHVFATWHPRTRPDDLAPDPDVSWTGLEVLDAVADQVEFRAHHERRGVTHVLHERSRFERRGGRWLYVDAISSSTGA